MALAGFMLESITGECKLVRTTVHERPCLASVTERTVKMGFPCGALVTYTALSLALLLPMLAHAESGQRIVALAGVNFAEHAREPASGASTSLSGLRAGLAFELFVARRTYLSTQVLLSRKGGKITHSDETLYSTSSIRHWVLSTPVMIRRDLPDHHGFVPYVQAGPELGFLLKSTYEYTVHDREGIESGTCDIDGDLKGVELGILLGGGVEYPLAGLTGSIEFGFSIGLTNLVKGASRTFRSDDELRTRVAHVALGISRQDRRNRAIRANKR